MTAFGARASLAAGLAAALAIGGGAAAQPKVEGRAAVVQKLTDCRKLSDGVARLACYDAAVAEMDVAEAKGDIVVVDREQARVVRRQGFGFRMPSLSLFERGESVEELENVTGAVAAARMNGDRKWVIELEDGAVWAQIDSTSLPLPPRRGMPVKIRRATLGSYLVSVGNQRAFRARREQ